MRGFVIGSVVALATGCVVQVGGGQAEWTFRSPSAVEIDVANGDIRVASSYDDRLVARWDGGGLGDNAHPDVHELSDGTIVIDANGGVAGGGTVEVDVPGGTELALTVDRGSIDVRLDEPADIFACAGAGSVSLDVPPGPYRLELGAVVGVIDNGILDVPDAPYTIEVCVGAGDVQIR